MMMWSAEMAKLDLTGRDYKLLWALQPYIHHQTGVVRYRLSEIAAAIGAEGPNAEKMGWSAMQHLIKTGVVLKTGRGEVTLNPLYLWTGDPRSQQEAMLRFGLLLPTETENDNANEATEEPERQV